MSIMKLFSGLLLIGRHIVMLVIQKSSSSYERIKNKQASPPAQSKGTKTIYINSTRIISLLELTFVLNF